MSADFDKVRDTFADQLASFDDRLESTTDDVRMLADIQEGIGSLLASDGSNEAEIRHVLNERYEQGSLRKETFQLVKSMLDRFVTEEIATSPSIKKDEPLFARSSSAVLEEIEEPSGDDTFSSTTVIPADVLPAAPSDSQVQVGSLLRDRFLLQEKVSGGSMGVVYKALDRRLAEAEAAEPHVAIKVLSPQLAENGQALRALQQEATKGRCLVHPNIVRFIDLDRDDDLYYLVMEWLQGRTLADILDSKDSSRIDYDAAFRIVGQIGDALDYAHRCGIVHADVKPGNIMLMPNGDAKLFDFGVARVRQKQSESNFDPGVLGAMTPAYSSMQVLTGDEPVPSDDVFSLGCLLYRLIAGHRVFGPRNAAEASQEGMKPQQPQGLSNGQWRALKKALSYSRVTRFSTIPEFIDALHGNIDETTTEDAPDEDIESRAGGGKGKWLVAAVVLLGVLGGASYQFGFLDDWLKELGLDATGFGIPERVDPSLPSADVQSATAEGESAITDAGDLEGGAASDALADIKAEPQDVAATPDALPEPLVDFSTLPPADIEVPFSTGVAATTTFNVTLREDAAPILVDFVRTGELGVPLSLKLDEVGFSGNRSPWAARQYSFSNAGVVWFPVGQDRSRITLTMASDPLREADQQSTLRLRETDSAASDLAIINVKLEDDDQRVFESQLPVNTIAFAAGQASIRETSPAVQIDIVRFNPDNSPVEVAYSVYDVTATNGEDYFAPTNLSITLGPGQRSARLLIPLVHDAVVEGDEAFVVELTGFNESVDIDVYQRIVVMIRDDEPQSR